MSFLLNEGNDRRRVSHVSNDEWRAALQQQIDEKKQREQQQKRERSLEDTSYERSSLSKHESSRRHSQVPEHSDDGASYRSSLNNNNNRDNGASEQSMTMTNNPLVRPGRRNVQHMSNDAWREALEQQIREKKESEQQISGAGSRSRQSQSAPSQDQDSGFSDLQHQERAMTTPAIDSNVAIASNNAVPAHGRRRTGMQTHEEHLQTLQEQLAIQKRFEEEALAFKRAQRQMRRKRLDDDEDNNNSAPSESIGYGSSSSTPSVNSEVAKATADASSARHDRHEASRQSGGMSNSADVSDRQLSSPKAEAKSSAAIQEARTSSPSATATTTVMPATDPVALAKIVDFCEELKRQNEDVKKQLIEQHSVLASLRSSLVETNATVATTASVSLKSAAKASAAPSSTMKKSGSAPVRSVQTRPTNTRAQADAKTKTPMAVPTHERKCASGTDAKAKPVVESAAPRVPVVRARPSRGESKIPCPSHTIAAASVSSRASAVAQPKHARTSDDEPQGLTTDEIDSKAQDDEKLVNSGGSALSSFAAASANDIGAFETATCDDEHRDDTTEQQRAAIASADAKASVARADDKRKDSDDDDAGDLKDDDDSATRQVAELVILSLHRESKAEDVAWEDNDAQHKMEDEDTEIVCTDAYVAIENDEEDEDELPLGGESKLLQCDARASAKDDEDLEIESCSSFQLIESASALVALDRSLGELFQ